jgi:hypothetical protein
MLPGEHCAIRAANRGDQPIVRELEQFSDAAANHLQMARQTLQ